MRHDAAAPKSNNTNLNTGKSTSKHPPKKIERCLETLLLTGSRGVTQPEAFWIYRESCLHTSVSSLQNNHGILIARMPDKSTVAHYGQKAFNRYWLADEQQKIKAIRLLNHYRKLRNAELIPADSELLPKAA